MTEDVSSRKWALLLAASITALVWAVGALGGMRAMDDAYITFRCSQNWADGNGLVFNVGKPVEATSNYAYALIIGEGMRFGVKPIALALALNLAAYFAILYALAMEAGITTRGALRSIVPMSGIAWAVAAQPAFWVYAHSGMETVFYTALLFGGFLAVARHLDGRGTNRLAGLWPGLAAGLGIGAAATVRMEAAAFMAPVCAFLFFAGDRARRWRRAAAAVVVFAAVFLPVLIVRYRTYGYLFPNTYYAKVDGGSFALVFRGAMYVGVWVLTTLPVIPLLLASTRTIKQGAPAVRLKLALAYSWIGGYVAYNLFVGGDYFPFGRFFVPVLPVFAWVTPAILPAVRGFPGTDADPAARRRFTRKAAYFLAAAVAWTFLYPGNGLKYYSQMVLVRDWAKVGRTLRRLVPPETTLFLAPAGAIPYYSGLTSYDSLGLTDRVTAHKDRELGWGVAGHEKVDFVLVRERDPDLVFFFSAKRGFLIDRLLLEYYVVRDMFENGTLKADDQLMVPDSMREEKAAARDFIYSTTMLEDYDLMELRRINRQALFFVKKTAPEELRDAFRPVTRPDPQKFENGKDRDERG